MEIVTLNDTTSTNDYLLALDTDKDICVVTDYQSAGKGMGTNTWESEAGKNLLFSILIHPTWLPVSQQYLLSMAEALAITDALGEEFTIKWPNDIYYKDYKLSGTRIDVNLKGNKLKDVVIGTGININQKEFHSDAPNPISLYNITGIEHDRNDILQRILRCFNERMQELRTNQETIIQAYHSRLYRREGYYPYSETRNSQSLPMFYAELVKVAPNGLMTLRRKDGTLAEYEFKEVKFLHY